MYLTSLDISDVRNIDQVSLKPEKGFNWFYGENGAGKTSLLESISILATGKSFRAGKINTVIRTDCEHLTVSAEIATGKATHRVGIQRGRGETLVRIDGTNVKRISALAKALPCVVVSTSNHELIEGGPSTRRSFIDWLLFHVEPESLGLFQRYRNALQQRNAALKINAADRLVSMWHPELIETGLEIDSARRRLLEIFIGKLSDVLSGFPELVKPTFQYRSGWAEGTELSDALARLEHCRRRGITTVGPHRADIIVKSNGQESRYMLSRGQQKLLAALMRLMQIEIYSDSHGHSPVVLFDDLPSELDNEARGVVYHYLNDKDAQVFLTSVDDVSKDVQFVSQMFHVKQGSFEKVI